LLPLKLPKLQLITICDQQPLIPPRQLHPLHCLRLKLKQHLSRGYIVLVNSAVDGDEHKVVVGFGAELDEADPVEVVGELDLIEDRDFLYALEVDSFKFGW
jgi:hypothetical protein